MNTENPLSEQEAAAIHLMKETYERWRTLPPMAVTLTRQDMWITMMGLQAAVTLPDLGQPLIDTMTNVGRQLQEAVCDSPEIYAMAEAGWNRAYDVEQT